MPEPAPVRAQRGYAVPLYASRIILAVCLGVMFFLAVDSLVQKAPTFDEQGFLVRGLGYLRGENRHMRIGHPLGLNALNALLLVNAESVRLPTEHPAWEETSFHRPAELFLWELGNDVEVIMFLGRLPTVWLGMLLAAVVGRWTYALTHNRWAVLFALLLVAFDPNILAHARLTTTDLGVAFGAAVAGYTLWQYLVRPGWGHAILAGMGFGVLQDTKFTAGLFVPLFALVILIVWINPYRRGAGRAQGDTRGLSRQRLAFLLVYPLSAFLTLWALYGFQIGTLPGDLPAWPQLGGLTLPLAHHLEQLLDIGNRARQGAAAFLWGQYSDAGWWYYFPVAFALKTPLPVLMLLGWSGWRLVTGGWRETWLRSQPAVANFAALLVPPLGYFGIALFTSVNLGYRHLLPILPFLYVFVAWVLPIPKLAHRLPKWSEYRLNYGHYALFVLGGWAVLTTLYAAPDFLAYFNGLAGGPRRGWHYLVDSNIDWGQDLKRLRPWMETHGVEEVWLSYFGEARPDYYGIDYIGLDSFPPRLMNPDANPFYPYDPAPGVYAISVTNLQGVLFEDHDQFAWFRDKEPIDNLGHSILLYGVEPYGEPVDVFLTGVQLNQIEPEHFALFETNQVVPRWFDLSQALIIPAAASAWFVTPSSLPLAGWEPVVTTPFYYLYNLQTDPETLVDLLGDTVTLRQDGGEIALSSSGDRLFREGEFFVTTGWEQRGEPRPVKIFIHAEHDGQLRAQWDGIGVEPLSWRPGDRLVHRHLFSLPEEAPGGTYEVWAGLYHPETGERWTTADGRERILLGRVEVDREP